MSLTQVGTASAGISKVIDGQSQYIFWRFSANPDGNPMTERPTEDTKYMGVYTSTKNKPSENPSEYIWTKIKGEDGSDGQNSYSGILTDEFIAINTDASGNNGDFSKASTSIILFEGTRENTSEWDISVEVTTGIQGSLSSSKDTYKVSAMTVDSGEITFTAKYKTTTLTKVAKIAKVKQGTPGEDGESPYNVELISSNGLIFKNGVISTIIHAIVFKGNENITDLLDANQFRWTKTNADGSPDLIWNAMHAGGTKSIIIETDDVNKRATFSCDIIEEI
ncbi:tail protein [Enterococcus phage VRE9_3]